MTIRSLDTSLETKRDIQLVGLLSSSPVRPNGMILRAGRKKKIWRTLPVQTHSPRA